jgi:hypothetical protein
LRPFDTSGGNMAYAEKRDGKLTGVLTIYGITQLPDLGG